MAERALSVRAERWPLKRPFTISRGRRDAAEVVVVEIGESGQTGRGECVPYARYGETVDGVVEAIRGLRRAVEEGLDRDALQAELPAGAARNALDCALWDLEAKQRGVPVWRLAGLPPPQPAVTAVTVSIGTPAAMAEEAAGYVGCPLLKIKLGGTDAVAAVRAVREAAPDVRLIVDANEAWSLEQLAAWQPDLAAAGVALIEQPLPAGRDDGLGRLPHPVPLCADESCHTLEDLPGLAGKYEYVNIKLDKTGGLTEAVRLRREALDLGFRLMIGCMVGTSLAMAPATLLAAGADFVDLDGPVLLREDREPGIVESNGRLAVPPASLWG